MGLTSADADAAVAKLGEAKVEARSAYADVALAPDHPQWTVCFQTPAAGAELAGPTAVELSLTAPGTPCPEKAGASLKPSKAPAKTPTIAPTRAPAPTEAATEPPATGGGGSSVYYRTCADAKAAGAAPIRRGQPGYGKHLDRDNDGIACDK
ncbi:excalibur calcium-binding domain-containing protein [Streptomyces bambusae]|uniref:excalibur calcium-binding domain-containing protein n=1 Tax=Streptomyces bambusae TaxID=1550616 RepID=UPI0027E1B49F|nr:excalibur calcium-binding domain-containing protein [Streptomyces bambusae]